MTFRPGLELSALFYTEALRPLIDERFPGLTYSAALLGSGSEILGFDTERSTDHGWGPRVQMFLRPEDQAALGDKLLALLDDQLPETFRGFLVRYSYPRFTNPVRHQVRISGLGEYLSGILGFDPRPGVTTADWLGCPTQALLEVTAGAVFHDGLGELEPARRALAWYPDDLWRYTLACQWARIGQEEAFVGRCGELGDELGSAVVAARIVRDLMRLCLLAERRYPPYGKWLGTAFSRLSIGEAMTPLLGSALTAATWPERERQLCAAYEMAAELHNTLGLTDWIDPAVRQFHDRPFQVLGADRFADALRATIGDMRIRALPLVGAIDQFIDNTDLISHSGRRADYLKSPNL